MSARISFDTTSYTGTEKWRRALSYTDLQAYRHDTLGFVYRVAAWNRREAARNLRATIRWADKLQKDHPGNGSFRATLQPGCAKQLEILEGFGLVKDHRVTVEAKRVRGSSLR